MRSPIGIVPMLLAFMVFSGVTSGEVLAQTGTIQGRVVQAETGQPVSGAEIRLPREGRQVIADDDGRFQILDVPSGEQVVEAGRLGLATVERRIRVENDETVSLEIELGDEAIALTGITVTGRQGGLVADEPPSILKGGIPMAETPRSVSIITGAQLALQDIGTLAEATRYTPGVQAEPWGFEPRLTFIQVRGFDATTTGLYRDGLQLRNPGYAVGYNLEPYGAERIEVLRGPASVLYGAGNPGGLINYVTKRPTTVPIREVELEAGSHDRLQGKFDVGGPFGDSGVLGYRITGVIRDSDTQIEHVENDRLFVAPTFTWRPSERTTLTFLGHYKQDESKASQALPAVGLLSENPNGEIPVDRFTGEPDVDRYDRTDYTVGYVAEHAFDDTWAVRQNLRYYDIELDDITIFTMGIQEDQRTIDRALFESFGAADGLAADNQLTARFGTGTASHEVLGGVDFQSVSASSRQTFGGAPSLDVITPEYGQAVGEAPVFKDNVTDQRQVGIYVSDRITFADRLILSLSARHDWARTEVHDRLADATTEQEDEAFTMQAGALYRTDLGLAPYVSYGESFLPAFGTDPDGEPFDPERGEQVEVGLKYEPRSWNALMTLSVFDLTREGFIQNDPETFSPVQTGEVESRGLELEAAAGLARGLDLIGSLTLMDVEITESAVPSEVGQRPSQTPDRLASLWVDYTFSPGALGGLGLGAGVRHMGSTYGDVANTVEVPAVTLADATVFWDWDDIRLSVNAQNVFDKEYVASAFWRSSLLATYGPARTVTAGLRYRW